MHNQTKRENAPVTARAIGLSEYSTETEAYSLSDATVSVALEEGSKYHPNSVPFHA